MNKQYFFLLLFATLLIIANLFLFYNIIGPSVFIFASILLLIIFIIAGSFYFIKPKTYTRPPFIVKQEQSIEQEAMIQNLQSSAFKTIRETDFSVHRKILFIEIIIILLLILNLILKIW